MSQTYTAQQIKDLIKDDDRVQLAGERASRQRARPAVTRP